MLPTQICEPNAESNTQQPESTQGKHLHHAWQYLSVLFPAGPWDGICSHSGGNALGKGGVWARFCPSPPASPVFGTWKDAHLFPLTVLVQHDDHQSGMHLVAFLGEGQVFAIPRHIDHESGERKRERQMFREKSKRFQTNERTPPSV